MKKVLIIMCLVLSAIVYAACSSDSGGGGNVSAAAKYAGQWAGSGNTATGSSYTMELVIDPDGKVSYSLKTNREGFSERDDFTPHWETNSFYTKSPTSGIELSVVFLSENSASFDMNGPLNFFPVTGPLSR